MLLLNEKHTNTIMEQVIIRRQETSEYKMNKQFELFAFSPPNALSTEGKGGNGC